MLLSAERIVEAMRSARLWRERCRRPMARGRTPRVMDNPKLKSIFLRSLRLAALKSQARRNRMRMRAEPVADIVEQTRRRALVREVRADALKMGPLPPSRPAASMARKGDLCADLQSPHESAALFDKTGICVFDDVLPPSLVDGCRMAFEICRQHIETALSAKGIGERGSHNGDAYVLYRGYDIAFNEVCQRGSERLDIGGAAMADAAPMRDAHLHEESAAWMPFIRASLGEGARECCRGVVENRPGSGMQEWHADGVHASYMDEHGSASRKNVPMTPSEWHARSSSAFGAATAEEAPLFITCFLPLVDLSDPTCGPTQFFPGSHKHATAELYRRLAPRDDMSQPTFCSPKVALGGMICFDYRLIHRVSARLSSRGSLTTHSFLILLNHPRSSGALINATRVSRSHDHLTTCPRHAFPLSPSRDAHLRFLRSQGTPNTRDLGGASRPMLYIVYARKGFSDKQNFPLDRPLFRE